jgi:hypothetical protein
MTEDRLVRDLGGSDLQNFAGTFLVWIPAWRCGFLFQGVVWSFKSVEFDLNW